MLVMVINDTHGSLLNYAVLIVISVKVTME